MKRTTGFRAGLAAGVGIAIAFGVSAANAVDFELKVAHVSSQSQPVYTCVEVMKQYVKNYAPGRMEVQHFPAGQLGNFRQNVEQVQLGSLELTFTTGGGISNVFPPVQAFDIPYLFRDEQVIDKVMNDRILNEKLRQDVLKATQTVRLIGNSGDHGWRSFFVKDGPRRTAEDMKGIKVRTIESPISMELARAVGMNPTPIPWQELYTSLATGIVAGTKNSLNDIVSMGFHDFLKYLYQDNHTYIIFFWWMNDPFLQKLPDDLKDIFLYSFYQMQVVCNGYIETLLLPQYEEFAKKGGQIYIPTAEEKKTFMPGQAAVEKWFTDKYGTEYPDAIRAAVKRAEDAIASEKGEILGKKM
jgi:TRAP-type C4-dicarboxylate transport system substrate-binding protein